MVTSPQPARQEGLLRLRRVMKTLRREYKQEESSKFDQQVFFFLKNTFSCSKALTVNSSAAECIDVTSLCPQPRLRNETFKNTHETPTVPCRLSSFRTRNHDFHSKWQQFKKEKNREVHFAHRKPFTEIFTSILFIQMPNHSSSRLNACACGTLLANKLN